jgi:glutamate N-acetyltransferase / amino-acid N-acetyltransferase
MTPTWLEQGHVTIPAGWRAGVAACGIKYTGRDDLALLVSDTPCTVAAMFTTNKVQSAHIHYDRAVLSRNTSAIRGVLINSGSANACTGEAGVANAQALARATEETLGLSPDSVLVMSTGVIGLPLVVEQIRPGIERAAQHLHHEENSIAAAKAIMTTDTYPKHCAVQVVLSNGKPVHIGGVAKGSGMIHPNMATMLCTLTTDAAVTPDALNAALHYAANHSFHCISVDGDTSTNDTMVLLANGQAGNAPIGDIVSPDGQAFLAGVLKVCQRLAQEVARDGEGASRLVTITVQGAHDNADAHRAAMAVARSPLVKTALFGADPNWGRIVCALGYSGAELDPERLSLSFGTMKVFENGVPLPMDEQAAHALLDAPDVQITAHLGMGSGAATVWTCDFSYDYVKINAEYRS